jgi:hypothetical protein
MAKEATVGSFKASIRMEIMKTSKPKLAIESLAFSVTLLIHRA